MKRGCESHKCRLAVGAACGCLLVSASANAQSRMGKDEAAQLYTAAGFQIVNDQPVNRCGKPAKPRVTFVDINADKRPEALFIDGDQTCYGFSGRYFAVLVKEGAAWRQLVHGAGSVQALQSRTAGWLDLRVTDAGCTRDHRYDGRAYKAATACNETVAAAPQASQRSQSAPASQSTQPAQSSAAGPQATQSAQSTSPERPAASKLTTADEAAAFQAAGLKKRGSGWHDCDDPNNRAGSASIESVGDLNGDGLPEAVITEGSGFCYGNTGQAFWLVSKQANGGWKLMTNGIGIAEFLKSKGANGWPDVSVGGPGFCFPVRRWNGSKYVFHRNEYEGKACKV